jgi:hypothetical protein
MKTFNFKPLVNVRTQKDEFSENVIATSVTGTFRFPPKAAAKLDIKDYDAVSLFSDVDEETGTVSVYIAKGHNGTIKRDENGAIVTGGRNTTEFEESDPMDGAIVRTTTADSKVLSITSSATWKMLGGSKDKELELSLTSIGEMDYPLPSGEFKYGEVFELTVIKERASAARPRTEKAEVAEAIAQDAEVQAAIENGEFVEEEA